MINLGLQPIVLAGLTFFCWTLLAWWVGVRGADRGLWE